MKALPPQAERMLELLVEFRTRTSHELMEDGVEEPGAAVKYLDRRGYDIRRSRMVSNKANLAYYTFVSAPDIDDEPELDPVSEQERHQWAIATNLWCLGKRWQAAFEDEPVIPTRKAASIRGRTAADLSVPQLHLF